jgi:hypothetical protein
MKDINKLYKEAQTMRWAYWCKRHINSKMPRTLTPYKVGSISK